MLPVSAGSPSGPDSKGAPAMGYIGTPPQIGEFDATEAEAINSNFNLVAYGIAHGPDGVDNYGHLPEVEVEYEGAEALVNSLDPTRGDVLFVEAMGHDPAEVSDSSNKWSEHHLDYLERLRNDRSINPSTYAQILAEVRGIPVVPADLTRQEVEEHNRSVGQDATVYGVYPEWPHFGPYHTSREQAVANTVKGRALEVLPTLNGNKPTYAVLFGKAHFEKHPGQSDMLEVFYGKTPGIRSAFEQLGLRIETIMLPDAWDARVQAMASLVGQLPDFPGRPAGTERGLTE